MLAFSYACLFVGTGGGGCRTPRRGSLPSPYVVQEYTLCHVLIALVPAILYTCAAPLQRWNGSRASQLTLHCAVLCSSAMCLKSNVAFSCPHLLLTLPDSAKSAQSQAVFQLHRARQWLTDRLSYTGSVRHAGDASFQGVGYLSNSLLPVEGTPGLTCLSSAAL